MELVTIGSGDDKVWVNPAQVEWFWNHNGPKLSGAGGR